MLRKVIFFVALLAKGQLHLAYYDACVECVLVRSATVETVCSSVHHFVDDSTSTDSASVTGFEQVPISFMFCAALSSTGNL